MKDFSKIKLLVCDCDGVLTDGFIIYSSYPLLEGRGEAIAESKNFSCYDGLGFQILRQTEIQVAVITGRESYVLQRRCEDLHIKYLFQGVKNKRKKLESLLSELNLTFENVAYIGDDWNDFSAMQDCQLKIAPPNAMELFKMTVDYVTQRRGGDGAVREAIEYILKERGEFETALGKFLEEWGR